MAESEEIVQHMDSEEDEEDYIQNSTFVLELDKDGSYKVSDITDNTLQEVDPEEQCEIEGLLGKENEDSVVSIEGDVDTEVKTSLQMSSSLWTKEEDLTCPQCSYVGNHIQGLRQHMSRVHGPRIKYEPSDEDDHDEESEPYSCKKCDFKFKTLKNLYAHRFVHDNQKGISKYKGFSKKSVIGGKGGPAPRETSCEYCGEVFPRLTELRKHKAKEHPQHMECKICNKMFSSEQSLQIHKQVKHEGKVRFTCDFCGKTFYYRSLYEGHRNGHLNLRPYKCGNPGCNRTYREKNTMLFHQRKCAGETSVACHICGMVLKCDYNLRTHIEGHHGNKMYACVCGKQYKWQGSLSGHKRRCPSWLRQCRDGMKDEGGQEEPDENIYYEITFPVSDGIKL